MKRTVIAAVIPVAVLVAAGVAAGAAYAAKPPTATLSVSPSPASVGDALTFSGCGYEPSTGIVVEVDAPSGYVARATLSVDAAGCFSSSPTWVYIAEDQGSYFVKVSRADGHKHEASLHFDVSA